MNKYLRHQMLCGDDSLPPIVTDGLIAEYKCDEGSGATITDNHGAANLAITGTQEWVTGGVKFTETNANYAQNASSPSLTQPNTTILCAKITEAGDSGFVLDGGSGVARQDFYNIDNAPRDSQVGLWCTAGSSVYGANHTYPDGEWAILIIEWNTPTTKIYDSDLNELYSGNPGSSGLTGLTLASRYSGELFPDESIFGYLMLYNKVLSSDEKAQNVTAIKARMKARGITV